jgi:hypothetical protein
MRRSLLSLVLLCLILASIIPVSLLAFQLVASLSRSAGSFPALGLPVAAYWLFQAMRQARSDSHRGRRPPYYLG